MPAPSHGITAEVIQEMSPEFRLCDDLIGTVIATIPPPPASSTIAWRERRVARLIEETSSYLAADAAQGRLAARIVILRDVSDDTLLRSHAPALAAVDVSRLRRTADALDRTAGQLERALERRQQKPTPFWGNQAANTLDVVALAATWGQAVPADPGSDVRRDDVGAETEAPTETEIETAMGTEPAAGTGEEKTEIVDARPATLREEQAPPVPEPAIDQAPPPDATLDPPRRSREGVTVEQGEGWSLEIWPARAGTGTAIERLRAAIPAT